MPWSWRLRRLRRRPHPNDFSRHGRRPLHPRWFQRGLAKIGATLNGSVGVGRDGAVLQLNMKGQRAGQPKPMVSLRTLLRDRYPGPARHVSILKVDIEGAEYDALIDAYDMCRRGELTLDTLVAEVHVGRAITSGDAGRYQLRQLRAAFANASACGLMLHHKERNGWGCGGRECVEFSWVSEAHARRVFLADRPGTSRRIPA